mmetsp:Transcript_32270/g.72802  ORF Transcript_32270/g.72802 Transcript_32270/m.72802 type:complete len:238 (+) Transcript_32270:137-850(+)
MSSYFSTSFCFCFEMREGMLLLSSLHMFAALFWMASMSFTSGDEVIAPILHSVTITLLTINSLLGLSAVKSGSESVALALCTTFGVQFVVLLVDLGWNPPATCSQGSVATSSALSEPPPIQPTHCTLRPPPALPGPIHLTTWPSVSVPTCSHDGCISFARRSAFGAPPVDRGCVLADEHPWLDCTRCRLSCCGLPVVYVLLLLALAPDCERLHQAGSPGDQGAALQTVPPGCRSGRG